MYRYEWYSIILKIEGTQCKLKLKFYVFLIEYDSLKIYKNIILILYSKA